MLPSQATKNARRVEGATRRRYLERAGTTSVIGYVPLEVWRELRAIARARDVSMSHLIRRALEQYLEAERGAA